MIWRQQLQKKELSLRSRPSVALVSPTRESAFLTGGVFLSLGALWLLIPPTVFVVGYRQFLDAVMLKRLTDILGTRKLGWTSPRRTGRLAESLDADAAANRHANDGGATVAAPGVGDDADGEREGESLAAE